jgi:hypothetical protein
MNTKHRAFEATITAAEPIDHQHRAAKPHELIDWLEEQQEEAEILHLRRQVRTNGRVGVMELY